MSKRCSCYLAHNSRSEWIRYCPLHEAAVKLLAAAKKVNNDHAAVMGTMIGNRAITRLEAPKGFVFVSQPAMFALQAAIQLAEKREDGR